MVARAQEHIRAGDIFQVVLSRRNSARVSCHPVSVYRALRVLNPSPYLFLLELGEHTLAGASPEMLVRVRGRHAETLPIAGTRRRGATEEEDAALERELLADAKELAEHEMLVDLGRNDLGRVCRFGSVRLAEHKTVHRFSHVMHIVSRVEGELREGVDALDALYACFPAGTVSGAPKVRAMQIVEDLEPSARGVYAGAVGYMDFRGDLDTCIAIRTVVMAGGEAHVQAGAGVVFDSVADSEYEETVNKARALLLAVELAESGALGAGPVAAGEKGGAAP
jgi:anthranilate synthase component 1